jgi:hypothetical protein
MSDFMEGVASDLLGWLTEESQYYANALRGGANQRSPFSGDASEKQKLEYYKSQMYEVAPDGTVQYDRPNKEGRKALMQRLGVDGYVAVYEAVRPKTGRRPAPEPEPEAAMTAPASMPSPMQPPAQPPAPAAPPEPPSLSPMLRPGSTQQVQDAGPVGPPVPVAPSQPQPIVPG